MNNKEQKKVSDGFDINNNNQFVWEVNNGQKLLKNQKNIIKATTCQIDKFMVLLVCKQENLHKIRKGNT